MGCMVGTLVEERDHRHSELGQLGGRKLSQGPVGVDHTDTDEGLEGGDGHHGHNGSHSLVHKAAGPLEGILGSGLVRSEAGQA